MAYVSQDPNTQSQNNTTNVLTNAGIPLPTQQTQDQSTDISTSAPAYISNGNPYGSYATPGQPSQSSSGSPSVSRKSSNGPSSGLQTNVQDYVAKNQSSSQGLGQAVSNTVQNTTDIARQNLQNVQGAFTQGVDSGSLANRGTAVNEAQTAYNEAANSTAPSKVWNANAASLYTPKANEITAGDLTTPKYSDADQALIASNQARVSFGDGSTKDYATQSDAQDAIDTYNKSNPGYYTYGTDAPLSVSNDRLSDILNASYQGPKNLAEIGGYDTAYNKYQDASALQKQAQGPGFKEELLNKTFATPTNNYSMGNKLLDDLLLGQGNAAATLKNTADKLGNSPTGSLTDEFSNVVKDARGQAIDRSSEINNIKDSARQALMTTAGNKDTAVNDRISNVVKDWDKYPQYFRDRFQAALDQHNTDTANKNQYDTLSKQYGDYDTLVNQKAQNEKIASTLGGLDINKYAQSQPVLDQYKSLQSDLANVMNGGGNYADKLSQRANIQNQINTLQPQYNTAKSYIDQYSPVINSLPSVAMGNLNNYGLSDIPADQLATELKDYGIGLQNTIQNSTQGIAALTPYKDAKNYDPNALNVNLSQLESQALGVQGGEGLYNLLNQQGVNGLIKTADYDKNKLISSDEQNQMARLQSIAQLAKDYGSEGSGVNYANKYTDKDLAGTQNATSALDINNFKNLLQGSERDFRNDAAMSNISGIGSGSGSSGGLFGRKNATAQQVYTQNFGDLINQNGGYRNMYSDQGVNNDLLKQMASQAKGGLESTTGNVNPGVVGGTLDAIGGYGDLLGGVLGNSLPAKAATNYGLLTNPATAPLALANILGSTFGGSSSAAQSEAQLHASEAAQADLQNNIQNKINTSGLKNQLTVGQNSAKDLELYKLLGMLDTTNL